MGACVARLCRVSLEGDGVREGAEIVDIIVRLNHELPWRKAASGGRVSLAILDFRRPLVRDLWFFFLVVAGCSSTRAGLALATTFGVLVRIDGTAGGGVGDASDNVLEEVENFNCFDGMLAG